MKIAIPADGEKLSEHFGHCDAFKVFKVENTQIVEEQAIQSPENHQPGELPQLLKKHNIDVVIAGGIGQKAVSFFNDLDIEVITGASGSIKEILNQFINGDLQDGGNICNH